MSVISNFESRVEGAVDGAASAMFRSPIEPAQIAKKAEKFMKKEKLVGSGRQYAPTLYSVLVNNRDDKRLFGFYPTMASEIENYLYAKGTEAGMEFDARPLVRFIPDPGLKKGRFDVIAEVVAAPIIKKLRDEELEYYGLAPAKSAAVGAAGAPVARATGASSRAANRLPQAQGSEYPQAQGSAYPQATDAPNSQSNKFAGLDISIEIDNAIPDSSSLPPLSRGRAALGSLPNLIVEGDRAIALPPRQAKSARQAHPSEQEAATSWIPDSENLSIIGAASLFNCMEQRSYRLECRKLTVGRGKENDIVITDVNASRIHIRLSQDATGRWKLVDLDSTNGTQLNGNFVSSAILRSGDEITIGTTVFQFID